MDIFLLFKLNLNAENETILEIKIIHT